LIYHKRRVFDGLYRCTKFGWNRQISFENMQVLMFMRVWLLKMPMAILDVLGDKWGNLTPEQTDHKETNLTTSKIVFGQ